ncbi:MAG: replication and repair protein RecF protein, partial [Candidatus Curtissbacteria bacterium GW2011_GWC2_41_21]
MPIFAISPTVLIGPNGSGKSNILEAIGLFSGIRPVKIDTDFDLVKFGESEVKIEVKVFDWNQDKVLTINMIVSDERYVRKAYFIDSVKKRLADLSLSLSVVIFSPQDLELVTGSPSVRRHHLDDQLSSTDREYHRSINAYNKIITRRNKILQRVAEGKSRPGE